MGEIHHRYYLLRLNTVFHLCTKKDHINNEDIWREAKIERMTAFLRQRQLRRPRAKKGGGGYCVDPIDMIPASMVTDALLL